MPTSEEALGLIEQYRARIDDIDKQLVALLNERSGLSLDIRALKPLVGMQLFDPAREDKILERVCSHNEGPLQDENLTELYRCLLKVMKEVPDRA